MTKKKTLVFLLILLTFLSVFLYLIHDRFYQKKNTNPYQISVIVRGKNTEGLTTVKQGIDQAAKDLNCEVSFVTLSSENNKPEQISLIQREIENGADAIVIDPIDSKDLEQPILDAMKSIPVVAMESTVDTITSLPYISSNNYQLGSSIAKKLMDDDTATRNITILKNSMDCSNIQQRYLGVMNVLQSTTSKVSYWDIPDDPQEAYDTALGVLQNSSASAYIALDGATLEALAKAESDLLKTGSAPVKIYGIGRTNTVVSLLENQVISAIGVENEFNLGYLSIQAAVDRIKKITVDSSEQVNFAIVSQENMYNSENQRLLFPFTG